MPGLKCSSRQLYESLKQRNVLVVPGEYFFFGLDKSQDDWTHRNECLRITFSQSEQVVEEGLQIIGEEMRRNM